MLRGLTTCLCVLMASLVADACSCGSGPAIACQAAWYPRTDAIFVGRVSEIEAQPHVIVVRLSVLESFRGVNEQSVEVFMDSTTCDFPFEEGEEYLVYAASWKGQLTTGICSATRPLKHVPAEDLDYLRSMHSRPPSSWVYGTLKRYTFDPRFKPTSHPNIMDHYLPPEETYRALSPESGVTITVAGNGQKRTAVVGTDGKWIVEGLPAGTYTVVAQLPSDLVPVSESVSLVPKACAKLELRTQFNGSIAGTILMPPPADDWTSLTVLAFRIGDQPDDELQGLTSDTYYGKALGQQVIYMDEAGSAPKFDLGPLPEGEYILAVYLTREVVKPSGTQHRHAGLTFFPGVDDLAHATRIRLAAGEKLSGFKVPLNHTWVEK